MIELLNTQFLTTPNIITGIVLLIISFIGISNLFKPISRFRVNNIPNYLISLGILGTFAGIFWGLINFDPNDIERSVPSLIDGMKFAFASSVGGMFFALLIKRKYINQNINIEEDSKSSEEDALEIERVLKAILEIRAALVGTESSFLQQFQNFRSDLNENMNTIKKVISGDDDSSMVTQIKLFRQESRDELSQINKSVDKFYEEIAGKGTDVLLEALKSIISDFNKNLNEQFGENFKQLNEAVGKILEWQDQYKQQVSHMIETQKQTTEDMKNASMSFGSLLEKAGALTDAATQFKEIMKGLNTLLTTLEQQRNEISNHLRVFSEISEKATTGLPKIEEKVHELTENLSNSIARNNQELNQHIEQAVNRTNEQVVKLDQAMSEELTKALESFGRQLTALSQKFVEDYSPLTERLKKVVELSRGL
jgi:ABC-type transporter Mla subunit MlaD